jgi:hypothetical protein
MEKTDASIPRLVIETTMAIFEKRKHAFPAAFGIARGTLMQNGFLQRGSDVGPPENIKLTGKGMKRDREMQRRAARRVAAFNRLYEKYEEMIDKSAGTRAGPGKAAKEPKDVPV